MSPIAAAPAPVLDRTARPELRARPARRARVREGAILFVLAYLAYAAVGLYLTLGLGLVVGDAEARLAHAYFVWWNEPSKLAAIGFYWPPLQTLVLLPMAAVKPLATSLAALPLTSAAFGAATLVVLDRALVLARLDRAVRWLILVGFGLNPMVVYYAANGMAEIVYLFFLSLAFYLFARWTIQPRWSDLPLAGLAFALGVLSRYEVGAWVPLVLAGALALLVGARVSVTRLEAATIGLIVPVAYGLLLWTFVTWTIIGNPFGWLTLFPPDFPSSGRSIATGDVLPETLALHLGLFPPTLVLTAGLAFLAVRRRSVPAGVFSAALVVNAGTTLVLLFRSHDVEFLQPRYNMRALPVAVIALAWLLTAMPAGRRNLAGAIAVAVLVLSIPATAATMVRADRHVGEPAFVRSVVTDDPVSLPLPETAPVPDERAMARFIRARVAGKSAVLTDDALTYGVMLADGEPDRYLDRIDVSDARWHRVLDDPVGRVGYVLVSLNPRRPDLVAARYPALLRGGELPAFLRPLTANASFALYAVCGGRSPGPHC